MTDPLLEREKEIAQLKECHAELTRELTLIRSKCSDVGIFVPSQVDRERMREAIAACDRALELLDVDSF